MCKRFSRQSIIYVLNFWPSVGTCQWACGKPTQPGTLAGRQHAIPLGAHRPVAAPIAADPRLWASGDRAKARTCHQVPMGRAKTLLVVLETSRQAKRLAIPRMAGLDRHATNERGTGARTGWGTIACHGPVPPPRVNLFAPDKGAHVAGSSWSPLPGSWSFLRRNSSIGLRWPA